MSTHLTNHVLVPVANEADAAVTASLIEPYEFERITVLHVVEKREGIPDTKPLKQAEQIAAAAFDTFRETFPDAETQTAYRPDVVAATHDAAETADVTAIAFRPRCGSRLIQWLSGDLSLRLITEADRPVIAISEGAPA